MDMCRQIENIMYQIDSISKEDKYEVQDYLDHDEWGIALETLGAIIRDNKIVIAKEVYKLIQKCGEAMELDYSVWEELKLNVR